jgi:hypothetical protein
VGFAADSTNGVVYEDFAVIANTEGHISSLTQRFLTHVSFCSGPDREVIGDERRLLPPAHPWKFPDQILIAMLNLSMAMGEDPLTDPTTLGMCREFTRCSKLLLAACTFVVPNTMV